MRDLAVCCWEDEAAGEWWRIDIVGGVAITYCWQVKVDGQWEDP